MDTDNATQNIFIAHTTQKKRAEPHLKVSSNCVI